MCQQQSGNSPKIVFSGGRRSHRGFTWFRTRPALMMSLVPTVPQQQKSSKPSPCTLVRSFRHACQVGAANGEFCCKILHVDLNHSHFLRGCQTASPIENSETRDLFIRLRKRTCATLIQGERLTLQAYNKPIGVRLAPPQNQSDGATVACI